MCSANAETKTLISTRRSSPDVPLLMRRHFRFSSRFSFFGSTQAHSHVPGQCGDPQLWSWWGEMTRCTHLQSYGAPLLQSARPVLSPRKCAVLFFRFVDKGGRRARSASAAANGKGGRGRPHFDLRLARFLHVGSSRRSRVRSRRRRPWLRSHPTQRAAPVLLRQLLRRAVAGALRARAARSCWTTVLRRWSFRRHARRLRSCRSIKSIAPRVAETTFMRIYYRGARESLLPMNILRRHLHHCYYMSQELAAARAEIEALRARIREAPSGTNTPRPPTGSSGHVIMMEGVPPSTAGSERRQTQQVSKRTNDAGRRPLHRPGATEFWPACSIGAAIQI
eukprot:SAG11_NODE_47_length_20431_cov_7.472752_12_plen_337_part_00